jgi:hypothetical protein
MCKRLKVVEKERHSVKERVAEDQQLLNADEAHDALNIYKTQGGNSKHIIQTESSKNKQEIIMQLNKKLENMFKNKSEQKKTCVAQKFV